MELFSFSVSGTPLLLSASETGLFLHPVRSERFGHPVLLCSGYKSGFSGCVCNASLYYTYINKENSLLLRRLHDSALLFRLDGTDTVTPCKPQLICFHHTLLLFYFEEEQTSYRLKLKPLFSDTDIPLPEPLRTPWNTFPHLHLQATEHHLYLSLTTGATVTCYRYSTTAGFEPLCSEEELLSDLRLPWEAEKKQLEQGLMQAIRLSDQQQSLLTEKEQKLQDMEARLSTLSAEAKRNSDLLSETTRSLQATQAQLTECKENQQQTARTLEHTSLLLERAKTQYNELMQVAEQYRQEALKWYGKFTDRN